ncbi:unnamed protein product [Ixodes hexagonus]
MECLMPSEVARLVLGYLKSTGCQATWESFLRESTDLKEYAEYARRGREYPTNIGGKSLLQLLDIGYQMAQSQELPHSYPGAGSSPGDLLSNIDKMVTQVKDMLSQLNSATGDNSRRISDVLSQPTSHAGTLPVNGTFMAAGNTTPLPRPPAPLPPQLVPQNQLRTATTEFTASQSSAPSSQQSHQPHSQHHPQLHGHGNDTLSYHLHTILSPMRLLQPPLASPLKKKTPQKQHSALDSLARFEPPEKDLGSSSSLQSILEQISPVKGLGSRTSERGRIPQFGAYEEGFLAYMNSLPRPILPRPHPPYVENEEPVRDSGIDLRKRSADDRGHSSEQCQQQPSSVNIAELEKQSKAERYSQEASVNRPTAAEADLNAEPASEGFEITETQTELSEEIDVEGSSRDPSPMSEEAVHMATTSGTCPGTAATPAAAVTTAPTTKAAAETPPPSRRPPASRSPVPMETPESLEAPPLPQRYPEPTSPRFILAQERCLVPSLTTPVKEVRFNAERFYSPRRKSLIPRRRLISACSPASKQGTDTAEPSTSSEDSREIEAILQELMNNSPFVAKLVENINQVVRTDGMTPSCSRQPLETLPEDRPLETRAIVSSQGINLPDSLIRDILSKTENDPVFEEVLSQMCERLDTTNDAPVTIVTPKSKGRGTPRRQVGNRSPKTPTSQPPTTPQLLRSIIDSPCSSPSAKSLPGSPSSCRSEQRDVPSSPAMPPKTSADSPFKTPSKAPLKTPSKTPSKMSPTLPVRVVSSSVEPGGQTVTCISIPDIAPEKEPGGRKDLTTLADIVDSVLTPENKLALSQTDRVPGTAASTTTVATLQAPIPSCPPSPRVTPQQQAVFITQDGTQILLRAEETITAQLHHPSAQLVHPMGTVVLATGGPVMTPCKVVLSDICKVPGFPGQQLYSTATRAVSVVMPRKSPAKKRLPLLQPKEPLPSQPPPPAFRRIEKKPFSSVMRSRLRTMTYMNELLKKGHASLSQTDLSHPTIVQPGSTVQAMPGQVVHLIVPQQQQQQPSQSKKPTQSTRQSPKHSTLVTAALMPKDPVSKEPSAADSTCQKSTAVAIICSTGAKQIFNKSPQLKSLTKVASRCISSKKKHVRVLDFESCSDDTSDAQEVRVVKDDIAKTIASIGTTLAGAMQRALKNAADGGGVCEGAEASSPGPSEERRAQKRKPVSKEKQKLKRSKNEDSLRSMDVNKFLDKIHK